VKRFPSLGGRLQNVLIASFVLVAVLAAGLNTVVISRVIKDYLAGAQADRVARDVNLANGFYRQRLNEILGVSQLVALDAQSIDKFPAALAGDHRAIQVMDELIRHALTTPILSGRRVILVLDGEGNVVTGSAFSSGSQALSPFTEGDWSQLPIVADALSSNRSIASTEVIPASLLVPSGLYQQTLITIQDAPEPFDPAGGMTSLALVGVYPIQDEHGLTLGMVVAAHLFNNDFTLVDDARNVAGIDVMTIFLGDLRVSTNIPDESGGRAVGTRASPEVYQMVSVQGRDYVGRSLAVGNWYIGRYEPLRNCRGRIVGMLYIGVHEVVFKNLVYDFNLRVGIIALICILAAGVIAIPITRLITRPIVRLVEANRRLAGGDMSVRVDAQGQGEFSLLGSSFNSMVETLQENERELLRQAKLASMGQLAAGVAHEINNPLGTILLYSDLLYKDTPEADSRRPDLKVIIDETNRCKTIVANLLNFAHQQELVAVDVDLGALLEEVIDKLAGEPRFENVKIVRRFDGDLPIIQADGSQLQQVFTNLLNNSADAMADGGTITISARPVDPSSVEISVADTGCGIPPENLPRVFTPFFTTKPANKGTGLGLSIVHGIIRAHHGQVVVQSQPGQGTIISISLPVHPASGQSYQAARATGVIS
jgi:two-component system NtrC family sensor kinase